MTITIRAATIEDAPAIAHVHIESWKTTYTGIVPASYLTNLDTEARIDMWREQLAIGRLIIFVAEAASGIVGFVCGGPLREPVETYDAELYAIYLLQAQQHQGTGRLLLYTVATTLRERGFTRMLLWVLAQNPATSFYKHLGAVEVEQKQIEIGGASLKELALGWTDLHNLAPDKPEIKPA